MAIIFGIDGIRVLPPQGHADSQRKSFVRRVVENSSAGSQEKLYLVGPTGSSGGLGEAVENGYRFVRSRHRAAQGDSPVLLVGFSRGAAGIIMLSRRLEKRNIPVRAMLLFDAADRHSDAKTSSIPSSVKNVMHVRRHSETKSMPRLAAIGNRATSPTSYEEKLFRCTHAAIGGIPWKANHGKAPNDFVDENIGGNSPQLQGDLKTTVTFAEDEKFSKDVWNHVQGFRGRHRYI